NSVIGGRLNADVGQGTSTLEYNGMLEVFYFDLTHGDLRWAYAKNGTWHFKTIDGNTTNGGRINGEVGRSPASFVYNGQLNVFYYDVGNGDLRHAWLVGKRWNYETLDGNTTSGGRLNSDLGRGPTVDVFNNQLHVFYYDWGNTDLRHAWLD